MATPHTVSLSLHQQALFAAIRADSQRLVDRQNQSVAAIIAAHHDPAALVRDGWSFAITETEIICTPPDRAQDT